MEFLNKKININLIRVIEYLDYESYVNLIDSEIINKENKMIIEQVNRCIIKRKELYKYREEYYKKNGIGYDKIELAWKDNSIYWNLIENDKKNYRSNCYLEKYYKLNNVWWFDMNYTFTNVKGKYRIKIAINKGNLNFINIIIKINNNEYNTKIINLSEIPHYTDINIITDYIISKKTDIIFISMNEIYGYKKGIMIYQMEII
jgi:hypothetical protein